MFKKNTKKVMHMVKRLNLTSVKPNKNEKNYCFWSFALGSTYDDVKFDVLDHGLRLPWMCKKEGI